MLKLSMLPLAPFAYHSEKQHEKVSTSSTDTNLGNLNAYLKKNK
jgi:hypothetical protein